jgi:hypothetical protein
MLIIPRAMSNAERQRKFQRANPGYDARRKSRERESSRRARARRAAELQAQRLAQAQAAVPANKPLLMLPAPIELPVIPGMNAISATPRSNSELQTFPLAA